MATLSYWQTARSLPDRSSSIAALTSLEEILRVDRGSLSSLLPPRRRSPRTPSLAVSDPTTVHVRVGTVLDAAAAQLGLSWDDELERISVHDLVDITDQHSWSFVAREVVRLAVQAPEPITRFPVLVQRQDPSTRYVVTGRRHCQVTAAIPAGDTSVVVELTLLQPLHPGEAWAVEYEVTLTGSAAPVTQHLRVCPATVRDLHLQIRFPVADLPRSAEQLTIVGTARQTAALLLKGPVLDVHDRDFGPGTAGVHWVW